MIRLKGITWAHSRGYLPMVATAQRFAEMHPEVQITWELRSLQAFADRPLADMVGEYDLLVIDHPHAGMAAAEQLLLPLDEYLPKGFLDDQAKNQVGKSYDSYVMDGHLWALPTDTAAPVASWRPDQLPSPPRKWADVLELAMQGKVAIAAIPIDSLMNFYTLCLNLDSTLFESKKRLVAPKTGEWAMQQLKGLLERCDPKCLEMNPIKVYEALASNERPEIYCPFAYGYSNYAREGYADHPLQFGQVPLGPSGAPLQTVLGGAGLAVSRHTQQAEWAIRYAQYVASPAVQSTMYVENGGQPGHRASWLSVRANLLCSNFFINTLGDLTNSYLRPRYPNYMHFQDHACLPLHDYLSGKLTVRAALAQMEEIYLESVKKN